MPALGEMALMSDLALQLGDSAAVWEDFYAPVSVNISAGGEMSASGRLTMLRGKGIFLSIRALGIEGGIVCINQDSIFAVDKVNKVFVADDYASVLGKYELTLENLQDILLGRTFMPTNSLDSITWGIVDNGTLNAVQFDMPDSAKAICSYSKRANANGIEMPSSASIQPYVPDKNEPSLSLLINYNVNNVKWNENREIKFRRPSGYRLINIKALMKALEQEMQTSATEYSSQSLL